MFSNHGELHPEGVQDGVDRFKAVVCARTQGFVQALPAQSRIFGDLRYASCFGHIAERRDEYADRPDQTTSTLSPLFSGFWEVSTYVSMV